jgi:hypothetical protein
VALNFTDRALLLDITGQVPDLPSSASLVLSTHLDRIEAVNLSSLELRPHEGVLVEL